MGALRETQANELGVDARLGDGARNAVQPGMEQEVRRHREFEIERRLLENDAEPASAGTGLRVISWPITSMRPESGTNSPESNWNKVDFPAPLGPSSAMNSPGRRA